MGDFVGVGVGEWVLCDGEVWGVYKLLARGFRGMT